MLCTYCPKRGACVAPCSEIENQELLELEGSQRELPMAPEKIRRSLEAKQRKGEVEAAGDRKAMARLAFEERRWRVLDELIEALPEAQRYCIRAFYWEGTSKSRIARSLGISRQAVSCYLERAQARIRGQLETLPLASEVIHDIVDQNTSKSACGFTSYEGESFFSPRKNSDSRLNHDSMPLQPVA